MGESYLDELKSNISKSRSKAEESINKNKVDNNAQMENHDNSSINNNSNSDNTENSSVSKPKEINLSSDSFKNKSNITQNTQNESFKENTKKEDSNKFSELDTLSKTFNFKNNENDSDIDSNNSEDTTNKDNYSNKDSKNNTNNINKDKENSQSSKISLNLNDKDVEENEEFKKHVEESFKKTTSMPLEKSMNKIPEKNKDKEYDASFSDKAHLVTKYGDVEIYRIDDELQLQYRIPTPKPSASQKLIINTLKEATTRLISTDPYKIRDPLQRKNLYYQKIIDILENAPEINIPKHMHDFYAKAVVKEMVGYGMIEPLLQDEKLEEIMIVGPNKPTYVYHVDYGMMSTNIVFYSNDQIYEIIDKIARTLGRRLDISNPLLDARLPDGSRVNATIPPASIDGDTITIRKFKKDPYTIIDLIDFGTVNSEVAAFLWAIVDGFNGAKPANIVISGGTGSGKTTTLNVLANFIPESNRILTIEDTAELRLPVKHVIRFEGKPPGLEGKGELSLDILVKNTLRMRPDRIIVGEIRHKEALSLFTAMNTGHDGCLGTIHSNSARETLVRITSPPMDVPMLMLAGLDFVVVQKRLNTSKGAVRRIVSIAEITGVLDNKPQANIIFRWNPETDNLERTQEPIQYFDIIKSYTKLNDEDIKAELEKKIKFLNTLSNNNVRNIEEVSQKIQDIYIKYKNK